MQIVIKTFMVFFIERRIGKVLQMRYYVLLAVICVAMVYVTVLSFNSESRGNLVANFVASEENPVVPVSDAFVEPIQTRETVKTPNGLELTVEKITNFRDVRQSIIVETSTDDRIFYFNVSIAPNTTWSFGKLNTFLIVPQNDAVVTRTTSYYPEGDELVVALDGNTKELFVFVGEKGAPKLVITNTDTSWSYDRDRTMIRITASDTNVSTVIMFWAVDGAISFIEDTRRKESLRYSIGELNNHILQLRSDLTRERENAGNLSKQLEKDNEQLEKARLENLQSEKFADDLKVSIEKGENLITAGVLLSPLQTAVGIVLILILLVLAADAFLFKPRRRL